jgi:hypothetical protein
VEETPERVISDGLCENFVSFLSESGLWIIMALTLVVTPVAMLLELVICVLGLYVGYAKKKAYGYLFAVTFLLFALFDYLGQAGLDADSLAIVNLVAILAALAGMYLVLRDT